MKTLIGTLATLLSAAAFASTTVNHNYAQALRGLSLDNACVTANEVKSINSVKHCTKLVPVTKTDDGMTYTEWMCTQWETTQVSYPRAFTRTVCVDYAPINETSAGECVKTAEVADFLPKTIKVRVVSERGDTDNYPGVEQSFTFPDCK